MTPPGPPPGFFGKLRSQGDFVGRRLPPAMRAPLDAWQQRALLQSRQDLGAAWLETWANSPLWRFLMAPGVCGGQAWAGVMMPSLDRVGRCFPLVLAAGYERAPSLPACLKLHGAWFAGLEDLALSTLEDGFSIDVFDASLLALAGAPPAHTPGAGAPFPASPDAARVVPLGGGALPPLASASLEECSAWWTDGAPQVAPCLALCRGLPAPTGFASMLDGAWNERGWRSD